MSYTLSSSAFVIRDSDGAIIPVDGTNRDYIQYLAWVAAGNTPYPYIEPVLTATELAAKALANGIAITSTSTPALNGTYALTSQAMIDITGVAAYILLNNVFPGNQTSYVWHDTNGIARTFPTTAEFKSFATVVTDYVSQISLYANSNGLLGSIPTVVPPIA